MQIRITARHSTLSPNTKSLIEEKLYNLSKLARQIREAHVVVEPIRHEYQLEISLHGKDIHLTATDKAADVNTALDFVLEKLETQLRRTKERKRTTRRKVALQEIPIEIPEQPKVIEDTFVLRSALEPIVLTVPEAIEEIRQSHESFLVFFNKQSDQLAILYPRIDGGYGLIEPKIPKLKQD